MVSVFSERADKKSHDVSNSGYSQENEEENIVEEIVMSGQGGKEKGITEQITTPTDPTC